MKVKLTIEEAELGQAIEEHVRNRGWEPKGPVFLVASCPDRPGESPTYSATIEVEKAPK